MGKLGSIDRAVLVIRSWGVACKYRLKMCTLTMLWTYLTVMWVGPQETMSDFDYWWVVFG